MPFCSKCGANIPTDANFCPSCGAAAGAASPRREAGLGMPPSSHLGSTPQAPQPASRSAAGLILPIMVVVAVAVIGLLLWSQRDGARPIAGNEHAGNELIAAADSSTAPAADADRAATADDGTDADADADAGADEVTGGAPPPEAASAPLPAIVSAATLDSAFTSNPADAAARYAGPVQVSGVIASMVMPGDTPALSMEGRTPLNHMIVNFRQGYRQRLAPLAKGRTISITCDSVRRFAGTTVLDGCDLR
jgi:zinc ribbon protein/putative nucleic acid binding protein